MYHYVRDITNSRYPNIKGLELNLFIEQIRFFKENYHVITMEDVIKCNDGEYELPTKSMILTFDDGYLEHFTNVYPVLKEFDVQGSFFVPAKAVVEHELLDVNKIHFILASLNRLDDIIGDIKNDIHQYKDEFSLSSFEDYFSEFAIENRFDSKEIIFIKRLLQHVLPENLRNKLSSKYFEKYVGINETSFAKELYMNKSQLKQLVRDGMHVGCHGYDHYWWDRLDPGSLRLELTRSKNFLESLGCNMSNLTACYPYGASSYEVIQELKVLGCKLAFTTEVDVVNMSDRSKYLYPRLDTNDFPPKSDNYKRYLA